MMTPGTAPLPSSLSGSRNRHPWTVAVLEDSDRGDLLERSASSRLLDRDLPALLRWTSPERLLLVGPEDWIRGCRRIPEENLITAPAARGGTVALLLALLELCRRRQGDATVLVVLPGAEPSRHGGLSRSIASRVRDLENDPLGIFVDPARENPTMILALVRRLLGLYKEASPTSLIHLLQGWLRNDLEIAYRSIPMLEATHLLGETTTRPLRGIDPAVARFTSVTLAGTQSRRRGSRSGRSGSGTPSGDRWSCR